MVVRRSRGADSIGLLTTQFPQPFRVGMMLEHVGFERRTVMARNAVPFQKGLSEPAFDWTRSPASTTWLMTTRRRLRNGFRRSPAGSAPPSLPGWVDTLRQAGVDEVYSHTQLAGASNRKAKAALGFAPRPLVWTGERGRQGIGAGHA